MSVQSVTRAFDILKTVAQYPYGIGVTDIARRTQLHKSTVSRLLSTLEHAEAVEKLPAGTFHISPHLLDILAPTAYPHNLITIARPHLTDLSTHYDEDIGLAIPDGNCVLYVDQVSSRQAVQVRDYTGSRFPLHTTSTGKLFLAYQSDEFVEDYLSRPLKPHTKNTLINPDQIRHAITIIRRDGFDWTTDEFAIGLSAISAPIFDQNQRVVAALNIYGPTFRFPPTAQKDAITQLVLNKCHIVSQSLGFILH